MMKYEFLEHTADVKFRAYGKTLDGAFENAVLAVSEYFGRGGKIKSLKKKKIEIEGNDLKSLFFNFLSELIYLFDAEGFVAAKARVRISGDKLKAEIFGDETKNYKNLAEIKAATYAEMVVEKVKNHWVAVAVVDV